MKRPDKEKLDGLPGAHREVSDAAVWARRQGFNNVAPCLELAAEIIRPEIETRPDAAQE